MGLRFWFLGLFRVKLQLYPPKVSFLEVFEVEMEVNDLQSGCDPNFRLELTKLDLSAKFQLPSFSRDFRAHDLNFPCKRMPNGTPPFFITIWIGIKSWSIMQNAVKKWEIIPSYIEYCHYNAIFGQKYEQRCTEVRNREISNLVII